MQQLASRRPALGSRKVFVIGDAELMVPQEASPEAANAFLKLLEEPPPETTIVLTSSAPGAMLPTILSRVLSLRVGTLVERDILALLQGGNFPEKSSLDRISFMARGSVRRAIQLAGKGGAEGTDSERKAGRDLLVAALSDGPVARLAAAHDRRPAGARAELVGELESLGEWLRDLLAVVAGSDGQVTDPAALPILKRMVEKRQLDAQGVLAALERVDGARDLALGNVNPQLIVSVLLADIQADLLRPVSRGAAP
jgi:DNA polymerase-3 subunit delta'